MWGNISLYCMEIFNSRKIEYKDKIRAIATDEKVKLRIIVPRSMKCCGATLCVVKENESPAYYSMFWAGMCGDDNEYWELHFFATTPGLYWYHFELDTPWGRSFVRNVGRGVGDFAPDASDFQQTVYDKNFKTPDWLKAPKSTMSARHALCAVGVTNRFGARSR